LAVPRLHELEDSFFHALTADDRTTCADFAAIVDDGPAASRFERIQIYANAYFLRLREVLIGDFPRLAANLGDSTFDSLICGYLQAHPSEYPSVRHLRRAMPEFIRTLDDLPGWAADLAFLELTRIDMFDAPDSTIATLQDFAQISPDAWPDIVLEPITALRVITCGWPAERLWAENTPVPTRCNETVIRVWRGANYAVRHLAMRADEAQAVDRMQRGEPFGFICEAFSALSESEAAREAAALLVRWLDDGIISTFA
jgi:hypothetical protein